MFTRRTFCLSATAALAAKPALSAGQCTAPNPWGHKQCVVGLQNVPHVDQHCPQWCWAACAELAFRVQGFDIPQEWLVKKVHGGSAVCAPAVGHTIAAAISGSWTDLDGKSLTATAQPLMDLDYKPPIQHSNPLDVIRSELEQDRLVIAGTLGHAIAITAMEYFEDQFGQQQLSTITVRDPWPGHMNKYIMSQQQFYSGRLLMTVKVR